MLSKNLNLLLAFLIGGSAFVVLVGLAAFISPLWITHSFPGVAAGEGIAFSYQSSFLTFYYGANDFSDLPAKYKVAEVLFPIALISVIVSIVRLAQSRRFLRINPSGVQYALKIQYQSFGFHLAAFILLLVSLSVYTSMAVSSLANPSLDLKELSRLFGSGLSKFGNSAKVEISNSDGNRIPQNHIPIINKNSPSFNQFPLTTTTRPPFEDHFFDNLGDLSSSNTGDIISPNNDNFPNFNPFQQSLNPQSANNDQQIVNNDNPPLFKSSLGVSFYMGWATFVFELITLAWHFFVYYNLTKNSSRSADSLTLI